jgi:hypothetical protein
MHDCHIVRIIEFLAVHRGFGLFIYNAPHRCFELEKIYVSSWQLGLQLDRTSVNTSPIFFSSTLSLANIILSGSSLRRRVFCVTFAQTGLSNLQERDSSANRPFEHYRRASRIPKELKPPRERDSDVIRMGLRRGCQLVLCYLSCHGRLLQTPDPD